MNQQQPIPISIVVEDVLSEAILRRIMKQYRNHFSIHVCLGKSGAGYIKKKIGGFNLAAKHSPFLILTDLDQYQCAPDLIRQWIQFPKHSNLIFQIAIREVEAWLLADRSNFSQFLGIRIEKIPFEVETIPNPKEFVVNLAKKSRLRKIREALVPVPKSTAKVGPDYNGTLIQFINNLWNFDAAKIHAPSLNRMTDRLAKFQPVT